MKLSAACVARAAARTCASIGRGRVNDFAAIEGSEATAEFPVEFRQLGGARRVVLFQKPQRFPDHLAR